MSKSKRTLASNDVQAIQDSHVTGMRMPLFVKKHNGEGQDFYYMGDVTPLEASFFPKVDTFFVLVAAVRPRAAGADCRATLHSKPATAGGLDLRHASAQAFGYIFDGRRTKHWESLVPTLKHIVVLRHPKDSL